MSSLHHAVYLHESICRCFTYHQVKTASPRGAVTAMISGRQSVIRKANPASSMLPTDQARLPITPINDLWSVSTHSMPARWGKLQTKWVMMNNKTQQMTRCVKNKKCPFYVIWNVILLFFSDMFVTEMLFLRKGIYFCLFWNVFFWEMLCFVWSYCVSFLRDIIILATSLHFWGNLVEQMLTYPNITNLTNLKLPIVYFVAIWGEDKQSGNTTHEMSLSPF